MREPTHVLDDSTQGWPWHRPTCEGILANANRPRNSQHFGTDFRVFDAVAGADSHRFVRSVASLGRDYEEPSSACIGRA